MRENLVVNCSFFMRIMRSGALAAVFAAAAVLRCAAFSQRPRWSRAALPLQQRLPVAGSRRAALACGRGNRARFFPVHGRMAQPRGDEDDGLAAGRGPKVNWSDRFKRALDMNPGRCSPSCLAGQCAWRVGSGYLGASVCVCVCVCVKTLTHSYNCP